jgi:hypothetical protein
MRVCRARGPQAAAATEARAPVRRKAHPEQKIIHAIAVILKEDRAEGLMNEK